MSKVHLRLLVIALLLPLTNTLFAQERDAGQMVVPTKYVDQDSLRLMLIDMWGSSNVSTGGRHEVDSLADVVQATWEGSWGDLPTESDPEGSSSQQCLV